MIEKLYKTNTLSRDELIRLIEDNIEKADPRLLDEANKTRERYYDKKVFFRGLIELSNYCKNDCYYCGIRRSNANAHRYRLTEVDIMNCCKNGYDLGFRTFVLQGGEDSYYTDQKVVEIVSRIKEEYPDCAITLSLGEKPFETYKKYFDAGADRYLLRHETATDEHYAKLHPSTMTFKTRKQCLYDLKEIGFQTGAGLMVGSPYQTIENLADDLLFLKELNPEMVGIGPFIPHQDTPFAKEKPGTLDATVTVIAITRLLLPKSLLPATTALGTINPLGREKGLKAGANVVMPNLSPISVRKDYSLYDNKICTDDEAAECRECISGRIRRTGFIPDLSRGDYFDFNQLHGINDML